ncbi:MAG: phosphotransferase [Deltaproteobacteria bacterium]|nr:phosphotransferase [Deltaproteobacteria bacterium]MBW2362391.1 phosphotransferase [Deltaproteobacteria bacterium]
MDGSDAQLEARLRTMVSEQLDRHVTRLHWLPGELGLRRFARLTLDGEDTPQTLIARIDVPEDPAGRPTGVPPEPPLEPVRALLERNGLPVPGRLGGDSEAGIELLEDAGDLTLRDAANDPGLRSELYAEACDLIPRLQRIEACAVAAFERRLDAPLFAYKAALFADHALPSRGRDTTSSERACVSDAFARIAQSAAAAPARLAHRDFQSANLHVDPSASRGQHLTLIDLQGALLAPPEYDAVCLLRDSYVELAPTELSMLKERVRNALPDAPSASRFAERFDLLTLSRKGKDLARFHFVARERGDTRYLRHVPATQRALGAAAERVAKRDPHFAALAALIAELPETPCEA